MQTDFGLWKECRWGVESVGATKFEENRLLTRAARKMHVEGQTHTEPRP